MARTSTSPWTFTLGRSFSLSYGPHALISALALVSGLILFFAANQTHAPIEAAAIGLGSFFAVFLAWAISREIDPHHEQMSFIAPILTALALIPFSLPSVLYALEIVLLLRMINRSCNAHTSALDVLAVTTLGWWLIGNGAIELGPLMILVFFVDILMTPKQPLSFVASFFTILVTILMLYWQGLTIALSPLQHDVWTALFALGLIYFPTIFRHHQAALMDDQTKTKRNPHRIKMGQMIAFLIGVAALLARGEQSIFLLLPLWTALLGTSVSHIVLPTKK